MGSKISKGTKVTASANDKAHDLPCVHDADGRHAGRLQRARQLRRRLLNACPAHQADPFRAGLVRHDVRQTGLAESVAGLFVAFGCLTIAWLLVAVGLRRVDV